MNHQHAPSNTHKSLTIWLAYAVALIGSALAAFGIESFIPAVAILSGWCWIVHSTERLRAFVTVVLLLILGFFLWIGLFVHSQHVYVNGHWVPRNCRNNLHNLGLALHMYHDDYGCFPPAVVADDEGRPMHSWRVLLLPYLDQGPLYEQYDFSEPWDGPNNRQLADTIVMPYYCHAGFGRDDGETSTSYVAVTGLGTVWPGRSSRRIEEITDGTSKTIMVIEVDAEIPWMEPRDLDVDEAISILTNVQNDPEHAHYQPDRFVATYYGRYFLMADGAARFTGQVTDPALYSPLLNIADGGPTDWEWRKQGIKRLRLGRCIALGAFIVLALVPLAWIWRRPRSK